MQKKELLNLGKLYPSDFLKDGEQPRCEPVELKVVLDQNTGIIHLENMAPTDAMYGKYWYHSATTATMRNELEGIVDSILSLMKFKNNDLFIDIACNDGTLLSFVPSLFFRLGIDPADDTFKRKSEKHADQIIQDYFSEKAYNLAGFERIKAKVITSIAMFYDVIDPELFMQDIYKILDDDGIWVMQLSYTPLMLRQTAFDNLCHEHWAYYDLITLRRLLKDNGFQIMDCQLNNINGGSFRLYIMKDSADISKFGTEAYRDVCAVRIESLELFEENQEYCYPTSIPVIWDSFKIRIDLLKKQTIDFLLAAKLDGKTIYAYGASTKGNTLMQYFGLNNNTITAIAERNPDKWGLRTVGTNIPICSEEDMRLAKPDYLLILPWHFISEFREREREYLKAGGKFIVPCPSFEIISA